MKIIHNIQVIVDLWGKLSQQFPKAIIPHIVQ